MIRTASIWAASFVASLLPLYEPPPHILHHANPHRLGLLHVTAGLSYTHISQQSHRLVATIFLPFLERQGGRVGKSINCEGHAVGPCATGSIRCYHYTVHDQGSGWYRGSTPVPWDIALSVQHPCCFRIPQRLHQTPHCLQKVIGWCGSRILD